MTRALILVVRGTPASGKSTLCVGLRDELIARGYRVSLLQWDTFHHMVEPRHALTPDIILEDSVRLLDTAVNCVSAGSSVIIIDGVFIYPEEQSIIERYFSAPRYTLCRYRVVTTESTLIQRNEERHPNDVLPVGRVLEVARDPLWATLPVAETVLDSTHASPEALVDKVCRQAVNERHPAGPGAGNPTATLSWQQGTQLRFSNVREIGELQLVPTHDESPWQAHTYFDARLSNTELQMLIHLLERQAITFRYLDRDAPFFQQLQTLSTTHGITLQVLDEWEAPQISIPPRQDVRTFFGQRSTPIRRLLKKTAGLHRLDYSSRGNRAQLWFDALSIDRHSWKAAQQSDMRSLAREDLQYLPGILSDADYHLAVAYDASGQPGAWSLMIFDGESRWYAAKWGCSDEGRTTSMGIDCLIQHLERLYDPARGLDVDLWGRRSEVYERLSTSAQWRVNVRLTP